MRSTPLRFIFLFGGIVTLLVAGIVLGVVGRGPWAWTIGLTYIAYDSWLLAMMVMASFRALRRKVAAPSPEGPAPRITVIICARNERSVLPACLAALRAQTDPADEILVVDDGSTDGTAAWLREEQEGMSNLRLLSGRHEGKAHALNLGWRHAAHELIVTVDADTLLEPEALRRVRIAFAADSHLAAACGVLIPRCRPGRWSRLFEFYQTFEYLRGFLWRLAWMRRDMLLLVSGAFAAYRRETLEALDGFQPRSRVEDYDLVYRLHRHSSERGLGWKTAVIAKARAVTDVPAAAPGFLQQRTRWFAGFLETLSQNRDMVANRRYGAVGRIMLPIKVVDSLLPLYALAAAVLLVFFLLSSQPFNRFLLIVLAAKLAYDLLLHCVAMILYQRWQGMPLTGRLGLQSLLATMTEPLCFQLLRHAGAALGWWAFLRGRIHWAPQRQAVAASEPPHRHLAEM